MNLPTGSRRRSACCSGVALSFSSWRIGSFGWPNSVDAVQGPAIYAEVVRLRILGHRAARSVGNLWFSLTFSANNLSRSLKGETGKSVPRHFVMNQFFAKRLLRPTPVLATHGWVGVLVITLFWPLNWALPSLRTHLLFFPLWLGYVLAVDSLVLRRCGTSILSRSPRGFALLFVCSIPAWWLFEAFNWRTQNWYYLGDGQFGWLTYSVLTSVAFSTVMPAVFETAELVRSARYGCAVSLADRAFGLHGTSPARCSASGWPCSRW